MKLTQWMNGATSGRGPHEVKRNLSERGTTGRRERSDEFQLISFNQRRDWIHLTKLTRIDRRERAALHFNSTNSLNSLRLMWIEVKLNERRQWVLTGPFALPFIQSEIKLIDWRSWIEHGEGNIITVYLLHGTRL